MKVYIVWKLTGISKEKGSCTLWAVFDSEEKARECIEDLATDPYEEIKEGKYIPSYDFVADPDEENGNSYEGFKYSSHEVL